MDTTKVQNLATLLKEAMRSVVITYSSAYMGMPIEMYKRNLQKSWDAYTNNLHFYNYAFLLEPDIENARVRKEILHIIRNELAQYIHEDRIQTFTYAIFGGVGNGFPLDALLKQLLKVALVRGERYAAQAFFKCVESTRVSYQVFGLLSGVRVEQEIQIGQGIRLIPLPKFISDLPPYLSHLGYLSDDDLLGRTLLMVDYSISPIFLNPLRMGALQGAELPFQRQVSCADYPNFDLGEFCDALSLSCDASIQGAVIWNHIDYDEIPNLRTSHGVSSRELGIASEEVAEIANMRISYDGGDRMPDIASEEMDEISNVRISYGEDSYIPSLLRKSRFVTASETDIHEAMSLYRARKNLRPRSATKLKVSIDRWIKSKANLNKVDTFTDLGIALESLYLEDMPDSGEFRFRLSLRAAWYLGKNLEKRQSLIRDFRKIYDLRSSAVHTGDISSKAATREFTQRAQDLCLQSIIKIIKNGQFPDWNQLVLGDDRSSC